jgi:hypothetical protein
MKEKFGKENVDTETKVWAKFWKYFQNTWMKEYKISDWNFHGKADVVQRTEETEPTTHWNASIES